MNTVSTVLLGAVAALAGQCSTTPPKRAVHPVTLADIQATKAAAGQSGTNKFFVNKCCTGVQIGDSCVAMPATGGCPGDHPITVSEP